MRIQRFTHFGNGFLHVDLSAIAHTAQKPAMRGACELGVELASSKTKTGKGRSSKGRVEPRFDTPKTARTKKGGMRLSAADRTSTSRASASKASQRRKSAASKSRSGLFRRKTRARPRTNSTSSLLARSARFVTYWGLTFGLWGAIAVMGIVGWYAAQMPQSSSWAVPDRAPNVRILDVDGDLLANRGVTGGRAISLGEMSPHIPAAVIAIEDRRFKQHFGIDPIGLARAMTRNVVAGRVVQGGSTLTQQLAKNLFLTPERSLGRKVQEAVLAIWLEQKYDKDRILEMYLNRVYFGSGATGVEAASLRYFNKSAKDVSLSEAALLAGLLKAPSRLSPARNPEAADARAEVVLAAMLRDQSITREQHAQAAYVGPKRAESYWSGAEHYVADWVMARLPKLVGDIGEDLVVRTSIDGELQAYADNVITEALDTDGQQLKVGQGALVSIDGTGAVRALVGGRDYKDSQFNRAVEAKRQPGSAFKPFVWLAALERGATPRTVRQDAPITVGSWKPKNYDGTYRGPITLDYALAKSSNTVAARLTVEMGPRAVADTAARLGIKSKLNANASLALGTSEVSLLELTAAYAPFANGGFDVKPTVIERIETRGGRVLYQRPAHDGSRVMQAREVSMMNAMLRGVVNGGTGQAARLENWQVAGKTGTSQNFRDALFVGYTSNLTTGIWFGNDNGKPTRKVTGGSMPTRAWHKFMLAAHEGVPAQRLPGFVSLPDLIAIQPRWDPRLAPPSNGPAIMPAGFVPDNSAPAGVPEPTGPTQPLLPATPPGTQGPRPGADVGQTLANNETAQRSITDLLFGD
ncbi:MAG: PBP1A family penicillin-binding protein [Pseudomonadota bacterium]